MPQKNVDKKSAKKSIFKKSPIRKLFQKKRSSKKISAQHKGSGKKHVIEANEVENQSKLQSQSVDIQKETESPKNRRSDLKRQTQAAKQVASEKARVEIGSEICTEIQKYKVLLEIYSGIFGYTYAVKQEGNGVLMFMRTEAMDNSEDMKQFKVMKYELSILQAAACEEPSASSHFPCLYDYGRLETMKFIMTQALGDTLYDITRKHLKSAFSPSTALRVSIQMLRALTDLHALGYLHRLIRPKGFSIGLAPNVQTVYLNNFGVPYQFRDSSTKKIRRERKHVSRLGNIRYMSRGVQESKDQSRRDDLESWIYLSLEFFDLEILPWRNDKSESEVLDKKEQFAKGNYTKDLPVCTVNYVSLLSYVSQMIFKERPDYQYIQGCLQEIRTENSIDFSLPMDWENLAVVRDVSILDKPSIVSERIKGDQTPKKSKYLAAAKGQESEVTSIRQSQLKTEIFEEKKTPPVEAKEKKATKLESGQPEISEDDNCSKCMKAKSQQTQKN